jgi:hypothetical protein
LLHIVEATSFGGPEDDGKLRGSLQEDTTNSNEETREENRTTSEEEITARTSKKGNRKADKVQNAGNTGDRKVARAGKGGNDQRASGGQSARAARGQGSGNYGAGSSATPAPVSSQAAGELEPSPINREAEQYVTGESPANTDPNASTSQEQYASNPGSEGAPAAPDPSTPTSPENTPESSDTDDSTETSPHTPASPEEDTLAIVEDLPPGEGSDLELDSPEG